MNEEADIAVCFSKLLSTLNEIRQIQFVVWWSESFCIQYIILQFSQFPSLQAIMMLAVALDHDKMSFCTQFEK